MLKKALFIALISAATVYTQAKDVGPSPNICLEPVQRGFCDTKIARFFYNRKSSKCERSVFGGCDHTGNNFKTLKECKNICERNDCLKPLNVGSCKKAEPRYYFNPDSKECQLFSWRGCKSNENNFLSLEKCQAVCEVGSCYYEGRWYPNGATLPSTNPCEHRSCSQGEVTWAMMSCARPSCRNPVTEPGKCCGVCPPQDTTPPAPVGSCYHEGRWYKSGETLPSTDPCVHSQCYQGEVRSIAMSCAMLWCPNPVRQPDQCCGVCPPEDTQPPEFSMCPMLMPLLEECKIHSYACDINNASSCPKGQTCCSVPCGTSCF